LLSSSRLNLLASVQSLPRDLRLLFLSLFLWTFGLGLYNYIWPLYLRDLQASPSDVGIVFSIGFLALALSMIPGGILANKYELKALLIIGWAMSIPPPLMYYFARTWTDVIPGIILLQVSGFNIPAFNAYIAGTAERTKSASNFGITWASAPLGVVFSPLVGSALLNWISVRDIFILTFVFFSISTMVLFFMKPQPALENDAKAPRLEFPKSRREGTLLLYLTGAALAPLTVWTLALLGQAAGRREAQLSRWGVMLLLLFLGGPMEVFQRGLWVAIPVGVATSCVLYLIHRAFEPKLDSVQR